jgi:hypothetical protein
MALSTRKDESHHEGRSPDFTLTSSFKPSQFPSGIYEKIFRVNSGGGRVGFAPTSQFHPEGHPVNQTDVW